MGKGMGKGMGAAWPITHASLAPIVQRLEQLLTGAQAAEDYDRCQRLQRQIEQLRQWDSELVKLPQELAEAQMRKDFSQCKTLKAKLAATKGKVEGLEARVLCEVRQMNPSLQQQRGWDDLSLTADLAQISLYGVSVANGRVTELALVDCGLTGRL